MCPFIKSKDIVNLNPQQRRELKTACKTSVETCEDGKTREKTACRLEGTNRTVRNEQSMKVNKRMNKVARNTVHGPSFVKALISLSLAALTAVLFDIQFFRDSSHVDWQIAANRHAATSQKTPIVKKQRHVSTHLQVIYKFRTILKLILRKIMYM